MKYLLSTLLMSLCVLGTMAQSTPSLKSEYVVKRSAVRAEIYPRINLNEKPCRFEHAAIKSKIDGTYDLMVGFNKKCDGKSEIALNFPLLEDAVLVKDLMLKENDYDTVNLYQDKTHPAFFEIVYKRPAEKQ